MAVTVRKNISVKPFGDPITFPVANGETIYQGTIAAVSNDGYLYNLDSTAVPTARLLVIVMDAGADIDGPQATTAAGSMSGAFQESSAISGDKTVRKCYIHAEVELTFSAIAQSDVGKTVYASDNYTVDETQIGGAKLGMLTRYISATKGWVLLNTFGIGDGFVMSRINITAATTTTGGDAISWANPCGENIIVRDVILDVTTQATGAATIDIGVAANGTTTSDTLIDGLDVGSAAIVGSATSDGGTNGKANRKLTSSQYVTGTPSATLAGLVGTAGIIWCRWE